MNVIENEPFGLSFMSVSINPTINLIYKNLDWWLDSGANTHVCADKSWFLSYQITSGGSVTVANGTSIKVLGVGDIKLKFTSGNIIILRDVQHVPDIRKKID